MRISAVLPVYNCAPWLPQCLQSLVEQTHPIDEVLIVDDGSTDDSLNIAQRFASAHPERARVWSQANGGPAAARNRALEHATGDVVAFLDGDDCWDSHKTRIQAELLSSRPELALVVGRTSWVYPAENGQGFAPRRDAEFTFILQASMMRRWAIEQIGPLDESLRVSEDTDWLIRLWEHDLPIHRHPETVVFYRRHGGNLTADMAGRVPRGLMIAMQRSLKRRAARGGPPPASSIQQYFLGAE